jgi:hypothetical protein
MFFLKKKGDMGNTNSESRRKRLHRQAHYIPLDDSDSPDAPDPALAAQSWPG